jgi:hypothetical protein
LGWQTPWRKRRGETPGISAFLQFKFYEKVYFLDPMEAYPDTKEKAGYWMGVAENVGDALCYYVLTADKHTVLECSAECTRDWNKEAAFPKDRFAP